MLGTTKGIHLLNIDFRRCFALVSGGVSVGWFFKNSQKTTEKNGDVNLKLDKMKLYRGFKEGQVLVNSGLYSFVVSDLAPINTCKYNEKCTCPILGSPIVIVVSVIRRDQYIYYLYYVIVWYTDLYICTDLYILLKPQSQLGYLGSYTLQFYATYPKNTGTCTVICVTPDEQTSSLTNQYL